MLIPKNESNASETPIPPKMIQSCSLPNYLNTSLDPHGLIQKGGRECPILVLKYA